MNGFISKLIIRYHGSTDYVGNTQNFIFVLLCSLCRVGGGYLSDKYGGYKVT